MKRNELRALHEKNNSQLLKELAQKRKELSKLGLEQKMKHTKNTRIPRSLRGDIAKILTVIKNKPQVKEEK